MGAERDMVILGHARDILSPSFFMSYGVAVLIISCIPEEGRRRESDDKQKRIYQSMERMKLEQQNVFQYLDMGQKEDVPYLP